MKYFGHQVNASQDTRLKRLRKACGSMGVDLYWRCLEIVGDKLNPKNTDCRLEYSFDELAVEVDSTPDEVSKALDATVKHHSPIPVPYRMPQMLPASIVKGIASPDRQASGTAKDHSLNIKMHSTF